MAEDGAQEEKKEQAPHYPNRLHEIRDALGIKHASELARKIGIPVGTYQSWENGSRQLDATTILMLSEKLGCTPNDILGYNEEGPISGKLKAVTPEIEEIIDLYLDNDLVTQMDIKQFLVHHAKHSQWPEKRHKS